MLSEAKHLGYRKTKSFTSFRMTAAVLLSLSGACSMPHATIPNLSTKPWTFSEGGVIRGEVSNKRLALIFTGGDFGEGTGHILDVLAANQIKGSFFFTGDFLRKAELSGAVRRVVEEEHYLGPHSDAHPLYCPWEDRNKTLV